LKVELAEIIPPQNQNQINNQNPYANQLTPEDERNIVSLVEMTGMGRAQCVEAYLVCGKNTTQAANLLFDG